MIHPPHHELIGKHISEIPNAQENQTDSYRLKESDHRFLGFPHNSILIGIDEDGLIDSLRFAIFKKMDKAFYNLMVEEYGEPVQILIPEEFKFNPEPVQSGVVAYAQSGMLEVREGTFEDEPIMIIWQMENYHIIVKLGTKQMPDPNTNVRIFKGKYDPVPVVNK